jgi:AraC-like DNA-binding protein
VPTDRIALAGCRVTRPPAAGDRVEVVAAAPVRRHFPPRLSTTLGICLKYGPAHEVTADGRRLVYPADTICVRAPGCVWSSGPSTVGFLSVDVSPAAWDKAGFEASMAFLPPSALPDFARHARALADADSPLCADEITARLMGRLAELGVLDVLGGDVPPPPRAPPPQAARRTVARAREYLHAHLDGQPTLDELAQAAGANKFVLLRQFRRALDTTPHAYMVMLRIERARELLAHGMSPSDAAASAGFSDQSHMGRWFRRICGVTPATYARHTEVNRVPDTHGRG